MKKQINYINNKSNRVQKLFYIDDYSEINNVPFEENDQIYSINDNSLYQIELFNDVQSKKSSIVEMQNGYSTKIKAFSTDIELSQSGSGDPSPSNVRPITSYSSAIITISDNDSFNNGLTYTITFPVEAGDIYIGTINLLTGKLLVTHKGVDLGDLSWTDFSGGEHMFRTTLTDRQFGNNASGVRGFCSSYTFWGNGTSTNIGSNLENKQFAFQVTNSLCVFRNDDYSSKGDFKQSVKGVIIVFPLENPVEYTLTIPEINFSLGKNYIKSNTGNISIEYETKGLDIFKINP